MRFQFLHAADIHLDSPLLGLERYAGAPVERLRVATREALRNLVDLAIERRVRFLLLCGDLYDRDSPDYNTGLHLNAELGRLARAGIATYLVAGNHDAESEITRKLEPPGGSFRFPAGSAATFRIDELKVALHGRSFGERSETEDLTRSYPAAIAGFFNIGLLHTSVDGREGHASYAPCTLDALKARGYDYWALGHVHRREVLSEQPWVVFPGNLQGRHARETGPKGATLVTVEDRRVLAAEHVSVDVARWERIALDAGGARDADEVAGRFVTLLAAAQAGTAGRLLALRVEIAGATAAHGDIERDREGWTGRLRALATEHSGGRAWLEKISTATRPPGRPGAAPGGDAHESLRARFAAAMDSEERLAELSRKLDDLSAQLPRALREGAEPLDYKDPRCLRAALERARDLLLERLAGEDPAA